MHSQQAVRDVCSLIIDPYNSFGITPTRVFKYSILLCSSAAEWLQEAIGREKMMTAGGEAIASGAAPFGRLGVWNEGGGFQHLVPGLGWAGRRRAHWTRIIDVADIVPSQFDRLAFVWRLLHCVCIEAESIEGDAGSFPFFIRCGAILKSVFSEKNVFSIQCENIQIDTAHSVVCVRYSIYKTHAAANGHYNWMTFSVFPLEVIQSSKPVLASTAKRGSRRKPRTTTVPFIGHDFIIFVSILVNCHAPSSKAIELGTGVGACAIVDPVLAVSFETETRRARERERALAGRRRCH